MANRNAWRMAVLTAALLTGQSAAHAQSGEDLRQAAQNPVANMISLPLQNNMNFNVGELDKTQNVLDIQPVIPISLNRTGIWSPAASCR